jgi:hypothetical protein
MRRLDADDENKPVWPTGVVGLSGMQEVEIYKCRTPVLEGLLGIVSSLHH